MPIRNRLLAIRLRMAADLGREVSQKEFAEMLGLSQPQYSRYERNKQQPEIEALSQILKRLGMPFDEVFYEEGNPPGQ